MRATIAATTLSPNSEDHSAVSSLVIEETSESLEALVVEHQARLLKRCRRKLLAHDLLQTVDVQNEPNLLDLIDAVGIAPNRHAGRDQADVADGLCRPDCLGGLAAFKSSRASHCPCTSLTTIDKTGRSQLSGCHAWPGSAFMRMSCT